MSAKINDGGAAFPILRSDQAGMTLRDWFAGQALIALLSQDPRDNAALDNPNGRKFDEWLSSNAYGFADAMLAARKGGHDD